MYRQAKNLNFKKILQRCEGQSSIAVAAKSPKKVGKLLKAPCICPAVTACDGPARHQDRGVGLKKLGVWYARVGCGTG